MVLYGWVSVELFFVHIFETQATDVYFTNRLVLHLFEFWLSLAAFHIVTLALFIR